MNKISNKVIVITGDSSGIGEALAKELSLSNKVYGISRRELNASYKHYPCDVLNGDALSEVIKDVIDKENHIDILICAAGLGVSGALEQLPNDKIDLQLDVNLKGVINATKAVVPFMREKKEGKIITISSVAAVAPIPFQSLYSASKAAINNYTCALANELRPFNIICATIMPGDIHTGFTGSRIKIDDKTNSYNGRVEKSVTRMEHDETHGAPALKAAKGIIKIISKKHPKPINTLGFQYKLLVFLIKILPIRFVNWILYQMYGK